MQPLLTRRFSPLPTMVLARIASASEADITRLADRVLAVGYLEEVFRVWSPAGIAWYLGGTGLAGEVVDLVAGTDTKGPIMNKLEHR